MPRMCGCSGSTGVETLPHGEGGYQLTYDKNGTPVTERYGSYIPASRRAAELGLPASAVVDAN